MHLHLIILSYSFQQKCSQQEKVVLMWDITLYLLMAIFLGNSTQIERMYYRPDISFISRCIEYFIFM